MNTEQLHTETQEAPAQEAPALSEAQATAASILEARKKGKKVKTNPVPSSGMPADSNEVKTPKVRVVSSNQGFKFLRDIDPAIDKFNNQTNIIIKLMQDLRITEGENKDVVSKKELIVALGASPMVTRQPYERVLMFYMGQWKKSKVTHKGVEIPALFEIVILK